MKPVFQTIIDRGNGNCMQAAVASLFGLSLEEVPHFIALGDKWFSEYWKFLHSRGYEYEMYIRNKKYTSLFNTQSDCFVKPKYHRTSLITPKRLHRELSIDGYFLASVLSPGLWTINDADRLCTHSVIIDCDYNIVHDPNPNYKSLRQYPLGDLIGYNGIINIDLYKKI